MANLKLRLFGHPVVELDGQPVVFETRKALAILIYLALSPQPVSRKLLAALFWPEFSQKRALSNLRKNLNSLANSFEAGVLEVDRKAVFFKDTTTLSIDVQDFYQKTKALQSHDRPQTYDMYLQVLEAGIQTYQDEFLAGFNLRDCPEFDDWQYQQRQALQQELRQALDSHFRHCVAERKWKNGDSFCTALSSSGHPG